MAGKEMLQTNGKRICEVSAFHQPWDVTLHRLTESFFSNNQFFKFKLSETPSNL
jgi:hypothetical protein